MIILDIETTGFSPNRDKIIDFYAIKVTPKLEIIDSFESLVNPRIPIPSRITEITSITNEMVKDAPIFREIKDQIWHFVQNQPIFGYYVNFDKRFLSAFDLRMGIAPFHDYSTYVKKQVPGAQSYKLTAIAKMFNINYKAHRAKADVMALHALMKKLGYSFA